IVISLLPTDNDVQRLQQVRTPVVLVDVAHPGFSQITIDDARGGRQATEHLLSLGHRKIGFLSDYEDGSFYFTANRDRYAGYCKALDAAGSPVNAGYCAHGMHSRSSAFEMAKKLLTLSDRPTAIFATNDTLAIGVLEAAKAQGLRIPE